MIDQNIVKSIFKSHSINKVVYIDEGSFNSFIIYEMSNSISADKWNNLEHLLQDITKKEVALLPYAQAVKHLGKDYLSKGVVIQWVIIKHSNH